MRFEICNFLFEYYFGRVCSEKSEGLPFNEAFFNSLRVTGTKMGILKCLSWFEMSTHIKDCVSFESFPFVDVGVQECCFLIGNFSRKLDRRVMIVCLFNEMFYSLSVCSPEREDVVYVTFPNEHFKKALGKDFRLYLVHEYVRKGDCHFRAHGRTMCLKVGFSILLERIFLEN